MKNSSQNTIRDVDKKSKILAIVSIGTDIKAKNLMEIQKSNKKNYCKDKSLQVSFIDKNENLQDALSQSFKKTDARPNLFQQTLIDVYPERSIKQEVYSKDDGKKLSEDDNNKGNLLDIVNDPKKNSENFLNSIEKQDKNNEEENSELDEKKNEEKNLDEKKIEKNQVEEKKVEVMQNNTKSSKIHAFQEKQTDKNTNSSPAFQSGSHSLPKKTMENPNYLDEKSFRKKNITENPDSAFIRKRFSKSQNITKDQKFERNLENPRPNDLQNKKIIENSDVKLQKSPKSDRKLNTEAQKPIKSENNGLTSDISNEIKESSFDESTIITNEPKDSKLQSEKKSSKLQTESQKGIKAKKLHHNSKKKNFNYSKKLTNTVDSLKTDEKRLENNSEKPNIRVIISDENNINRNEDKNEIFDNFGHSVSNSLNVIYEKAPKRNSVSLSNKSKTRNSINFEESNEKLKKTPEDSEEIPKTETKSTKGNPRFSIQESIESLKKENLSKRSSFGQLTISLSSVKRESESLSSRSDLSKKITITDDKNLVLSKKNEEVKDFEKKLTKNSSLRKQLKFITRVNTNKKAKKESDSDSASDIQSDSEELALGQRKKSINYELDHLDYMKHMFSQLHDEKTIKESQKFGTDQGIINDKQSDLLNESEEKDNFNIYEDLENIMRNKHFSVTNFAFSPQVTFKFAQRYEINPGINVNDIEINEYNMDPSAFDNYLLKNKFLSRKNQTRQNYVSSNKNLEVLKLEELLPSELNHKRVKDFEKMRKKERIFKNRGKITEIGGKQKKTFSNLVKNSLTERKLAEKKKFSDDFIIKSGGSDRVSDELHSCERIYCRVKDIYDLNYLSKKRTGSAELLIKGLQNDFLKLERICNN